jgi:uncharacterized protein YdeI (YjbR/CyaY-like superfamily)
LNSNAFDGVFMFCGRLTFSKIVYNSIMDTFKDVSILHFTTPALWEAWLKKHQATEQALWMKFAKKDSGAVSISYDEALNVALCYGWIDGQVQKFDAQYWLTRFTPRRSKSIWSKRNREIVTTLIAQGKMQPAGLAQIEAAKKDGRWDAAYDTPKNMIMPEDFLNALAKDKKAEAFFQTLSKANTYAIGWRLQTAKKPETREKRMQTILEILAKGEKCH